MRIGGAPGFENPASFLPYRPGGGGLGTDLGDRVGTTPWNRAPGEPVPGNQSGGIIRDNAPRTSKCTVPVVAVPVVALSPSSPPVVAPVPVVVVAPSSLSPSSHAGSIDQSFQPNRRNSLHSADLAMARPSE